MIVVERLSKYYGFTKAVDDLSFKVDRGEILGFLGPNGAGKTTTMKMLTCYLPPSSGRATIFGYDIRTDSMEVRRRIGYLPERAPLYTDMKVDGFLRFAAKLKGIEPGGLKGAVDGAIERCGLESVFKKTIGKLSKGYQQRVGIAQAIVHGPELLILDEPTIGLDPRQIIDIRQLIKSLGEERTVILSSHILPEVNQVCNRVVIISGGRLVAVDTPDNLRERLTKASVTHVSVEDTKESGSVDSILEGTPGVLSVRKTEAREGAVSFLVESTSDIDIRKEAVSRLVGAGIGLLEIYNEELTLEDIFIKLVTEEEA